ncbi:MAG: capsule assembly Wzi family protein [Pseudomonadota bacterium]
MPVSADAYISPGDMALRHDIQVLADSGYISGPIMTWPLAWGAVVEGLESADLSNAPNYVIDSAARVLARSRWHTRSNEWQFRAEASVSENPIRIRSFANTPREEVQATVGASLTNDWIAVDLRASVVESPLDGDEVRADGSMIGVMLGNWSVSANTLDKHWGPGWDGSLILSGNARPMPSLTIDRVYTDAFESRWLSWLGPWDLTVTFGQLEKERTVPDAQFFGMRFGFRPIPSLELGVSRSALWCGEDRPCGLDTFADLFLGNDNVGDSGISTGNEPGNQLGGFDFRWSTALFNRPVAIYGQFIGEDEAGGFPSRFLGQGGVEVVSYWADRWSVRAFGEIAATTCQFHESSELFNCAYNHGIYQTGYRYKGSVIGHGVDNDARVASLGLILVDSDNMQWRGILRYGELNRGGAPDPNNTLTATPADLSSIDIAHSRALKYGVIEVGVGYQQFDQTVDDSSSSDGRIYLNWRSSY